MEDWKAIDVLESEKKNYNYRDELYVAMNRGIDALYFEMRARELFNAVVKLLSKQKESSHVLNMLEETVYYDEVECDGSCLIDDILHLLIDNA